MCLLNLVRESRETRSLCARARGKMTSFERELSHKLWSFAFYLVRNYPRLMFGVSPDGIFACCVYLLRWLNKLGLNRTRVMCSHGWTWDKKEALRCPMSVREKLVDACAKNGIAEAADIRWAGATKEVWKYSSFMQRRDYELKCEIGEFASFGIEEKEIEYDESLSTLQKARVMRVWRTDVDLRECNRYCILLPFTGDEGFLIRRERSQELVAKGVCCLIPEFAYYGTRRALKGQTEFFMRSFSDFCTKALVTYADVVALTAYVKEELAMHEHENGDLLISGCSIGGYYCAQAASLAQLLTKNKKMKKSQRMVDLKIGISVFCGWTSYFDWFEDDILINLDTLAEQELSSLDKMTKDVSEAYHEARKETNLRARSNKMRKLLALLMNDMTCLSSLKWRIKERAKKLKTTKKLLNFDGILDAASFTLARRDKFVPHSEQKMERDSKEMSALSRTKAIVQVFECDHMETIQSVELAIPIILDTFDRMSKV
jgi:hypothetical protein